MASKGILHLAAFLSDNIKRTKISVATNTNMSTPKFEKFRTTISRLGKAIVRIKMLRGGGNI